MGIINDLFGGFGTPGTNPKGIGKIEQFCSQLGWDIANRSGRSVAIPFTLSIGQRYLVISVEETGQVGVAGMASGFEIQPNRMHEMLAPCLLARNHEMPMGAWKMEMDGNCVEFKVQYTFITEGMTLQIFKSMCEGLAVEVGTSIGLARRKGWL